MKFNKIYCTVLLLTITKCLAQNAVTEIKTKDGIHFISTNIEYPITGTYLFQGKEEPIVELNANGTGFYQLHEQTKRAMIWGIECNKSGEPKFIKGYDNAAYTLWYQYTSITESDPKNDWNAVEFTIHFNTLKMFIQGERSKDYTDTVEK